MFKTLSTLAARVMGNKEATLIQHEDGNLGSQYVYTLNTPELGPTMSIGFSVGFKIQENADGAFEIHRHQQGFHAKYTAETKTLEFVANAHDIAPKIIDTAPSLDEAKVICLEAFKAHKTEQLAEQSAREVARKNGTLTVAGRHYIGITVGDTPLKPAMKLKF